MLVDENDEEVQAVFQALRIDRRSGEVSWPEPLIFLDIPFRDVLTKIDDPVEVIGPALNLYRLSPDSLKIIRSSFSRYKSKKMLYSNIKSCYLVYKE